MTDGAKVLNMQGEDITPQPATEEQILQYNFERDLVQSFQTGASVEEMSEFFFNKYLIKFKPKE